MFINGAHYSRSPIDNATKNFLEVKNSKRVRDEADFKAEAKLNSLKAGRRCNGHDFTEFFII